MMLQTCSMINSLTTTYLNQMESSALAAGINLADVCKAEGVAATTLQRWRKGKVTPRLETTEKILQRIRVMTAARSRTSEAA